MQTIEFWRNKKVLITGGTSGLGQALNIQLIELGAQTATVARKALSKTIQGDISDKRQIHRIYAEALTQLGHIDVLINNASSLGPVPLRPLLDTDCEDLSAVFETNLLGPFRLSKLVVSDMILNHFGWVVNISSDAAVNAYPNWGAYGVSKAALDHLSRIFQAELINTEVKFVALDPGDMDTPLHLAAIPNADRAALFDPADSARLLLDQIAEGQLTPIRRSLR